MATKKATKYVTKTLTLPDGRRKYIRGRTEKEAEEKLLEAKLQLKVGVNIGDDTTFMQLAQTWYDLFKKGRLHARSLEAIKWALNGHILPILGPMKVRDIRPVHVQQVMAEASGLAQSSQKKILQYTREVLSLGVDNGLISKSPAVKYIKAGGAPAKEEVPLTPAQSEALLVAVRDTRAYPLVLLLLHAGLRRSEACGVRWADFDFDAGVLKVRRSIIYTPEHREGLVNDEMKTSAAHRDIPLPLPVLAYFRNLQKSSTSEYVLSMTNSNDYLTANGFENLWSLVKRRSKVTTPNTTSELAFDFYTHPHQLRHTCITRWFETGLDIKEIQYLAGHATPEMTLRVYTHYDKASREEETAKKIQESLPEEMVL